MSVLNKVSVTSSRFYDTTDRSDICALYVINPFGLMKTTEGGVVSKAEAVLCKLFEDPADWYNLWLVFTCIPLLQRPQEAHTPFDC